MKAPTTSYRVTEAGGPVTSVAGKRVRPGDTVHLTRDQAVFERSRGLVEPSRAEAPKRSRKRAA